MNTGMMSQSFVMGYGGIEHNLRQCKGGSVRQNGIKERRHLNEYLINKDVRDVIKNEIGEKLNEINNKHIAQGHPGRVCTLDDWIKKQEYTRQGKQRKIVSEYIIQIGDKFSGCPYEIQKDNKGNMLDVNGEIIPEWDTRKRPAYRDGKIVESEICKRLKTVYRDYLNRFIKTNPQARVVCAAIHADEYGGVHMHIDVVWISYTKNGVGIGLSKTQAMRQQYIDMGKATKDTRRDNAQNTWRADMKLLLKKCAFDHGIEKLRKGNSEKHRDTNSYKNFKSDYCEALEARAAELDAKEKELSKDIAKQEWYILKTKYPALYKKIHNDYTHSKTKVLAENTIT